MLEDIFEKLRKQGVCVDKRLLVKIGEDAGKTIERLKKILSNFGCNFNINSHQRLKEYFFDKLRLPPVIETNKGDLSVDNKTLTLFLETGPSLIKYLIRYRKTMEILKHCKSIEKFLDRDNRCHPSYNLDSVTGRAYSNNPSIQDIPKKLRKIIVPSKGKVFVSSDYSQIDVRILAHFSMDPLLLKDFNEGKDIYSEIAKDLNVGRDVAKRICLSLIYGRRKWGLSQDLSISQAEAEGYINTFFKKYKGVKKFIDDVIREASKKEYVLSLAGRKIPPDKDIRKKAIARKIQASTADVFLQGALVNLFKALDGEKTRIVFQVHDDLVVETSVEFVKSTEKLVNEVMENAWALRVPLRVKTKISSRWK